MCSCGTCDKLSWFFCNTQRSPAKRLFCFSTRSPASWRETPLAAIDGPSTGHRWRPAPPLLVVQSARGLGHFRAPNPRPLRLLFVPIYAGTRPTSHANTPVLRCGGRQFYIQATISSLAWVGPFVHCLHARNPEHIQGYFRRR